MSRGMGIVAIVLSVTAGLTACGTVEPDDGQWRPLGLDGMWVTAVAQTPWGLFAGTRDDGVFRLDSDSTQWQPLGLAHLSVYCMLFVPAAQPRLLVGVGIRTWESSIFATEDGSTWTPADGGLAASAGPAISLAADPARPERLYWSAGAGASTLRSEDAGQTWRYVRGGPGLIAGGGGLIAVSPARDGTVWTFWSSIFEGHGLSRSRDWGDTWEVLRPAPGPIYALSVDPRNTSRLWAGAMFSGDAGETWQGSLNVESTTISALVWLDGDLLAIGTYRHFDNSEATTTETDRLRLYRLRGGAGRWETIAVPSDVRGGQSATIDSHGRLVVGTARSGVWVWEP